MSPRLYVSWSFRLIPQPCFQTLEIRTIQDAALHSRPFLWKGLTSVARQGWLHGCWDSDSLSPFKIRFADFCGALRRPSPLPLFQRKKVNRRACSFHLFFIQTPLASPASSLHFAICHAKSASPHIRGRASAYYMKDVWRLRSSRIVPAISHYFPRIFSAAPMTARTACSKVSAPWKYMT